MPLSPSQHHDKLQPTKWDQLGEFIRVEFFNQVPVQELPREATVGELVRRLLAYEHVATHIAELMQVLLKEHEGDTPGEHEGVKLATSFLQELANLPAAEMGADCAGPKYIGTFLHSLAVREPLMLVLNLSSLSAAAWRDAFGRMLRHDHAPSSSAEIAADDPFLGWMSPERCAREVYIDSGDRRVPPLRRCKLATLCDAARRGRALRTLPGPYCSVAVLGLTERYGTT